MLKHNPSGWFPKGATMFKPILCPIHLRLTRYERIEMTKSLGQQLYELVHDRQFSHGDLEYHEMMAWEDMAKTFLASAGLEPLEVGAAPPPETVAPDGLVQIQNEICDWAMQEFGENKSKWTGQVLGSLASFLGMVEEIGEMAHAILYRHQGRGFTTDEEYRAAIEDGLADLDVFACDFANREGINRLANLRKVWAKVCKRRRESWLKDKANEEKDLASANVDGTEPEKNNAKSVVNIQAGPDGRLYYTVDEVESSPFKESDTEQIPGTPAMKPFISTAEQTGQGWAEPSETDEVGVELTPSRGGCWFCHEGGCDRFSTEFDTYLHSSCLIAADGPEADIMRREIGLKKTKPEEHWTDNSPKDGFEVAREIAHQYAEGQNREYALKTIAAHENIYKEYQLRCRHIDPDRSGYCIRCGVELC